MHRQKYGSRCGRLYIHASVEREREREKESEIEIDVGRHIICIFFVFLDKTRDVHRQADCHPPYYHIPPTRAMFVISTKPPSGKAPACLKCPLAGSLQQSVRFAAVWGGGKHRPLTWILQPSQIMAGNFSDLQFIQNSITRHSSAVSARLAETQLWRGFAAFQAFRSLYWKHSYA